MKITDLAPRHYATLRVLTAGPCSEGLRPSQIGELTGRSGATVSRILYDLRELGLAARDDATSQHVITSAGIDALATLQ